MKILTKEEEQAHTREVWTGGIVGGLTGLGLGALGVWGASARYPAFRQLSVPFRAFIITSTGTAGGVISADRYSHAFEKSRHADFDYQDRSKRELQDLEKREGVWQKVTNFVSEQRYPIVFGSWVAGMAIALGVVGRHKELTAQQKLVQARVYAQGLTLAVLVASFGLEGNDLRAGKGRWETIKVLDPNDPEHKRLIEKRIHHEAYSGEDQWMDMIESQERKMKSRGHRVHGGDGKNGNKGDSKSNDQDDGNDSEKTNEKDTGKKNQKESSNNKKESSNNENKGSNKKEPETKEEKSGAPTTKKVDKAP